MADELQRATERLTDELVDGAGDERSPAELAYATVSDIRLILSANREMREEIEVAAVHIQLAAGWLREAGDDGQRANTLLNASNRARSALSTKEQPNV